VGGEKKFYMKLGRGGGERTLEGTVACPKIRGGKKVVVQQSPGRKKKKKKGLHYSLDGARERRLFAYTGGRGKTFRTSPRTPGGKMGRGGEKGYFKLRKRERMIIKILFLKLKNYSNGGKKSPQYNGLVRRRGGGCVIPLPELRRFSRRRRERVAQF